MDRLELFKVLADKLYYAIPKKDRNINTRYLIVVKLLCTSYGSNLGNLTLQDCSYILDISRERVRQIEGDGLDNIKRCPETSNDLMDYIYDIEKDTD